MALLLLAALAFIQMHCEPTETPDPDPVKITVSDLIFFEGDEITVKTFNLSTNIPAEETISIDYFLQEISATGGTDYVDMEGVITIEKGAQAVGIEVQIIGDSIRESDESFKLILHNPVNGVLIKSEAIATIRNDDTFIDIPDDGYITPLTYGGYSLVWHDEFDGSEINKADWTHEIGDHGWGNNEWQYYTESEKNSFISNGNLVIEAIEEDYQGADYTSARMITRDKQEFAFGRVDIRGILPKGQGIWPALWMLGANHTEIGWPACGEIDIMELVGHKPAEVHGTAHWGPQGQSWSHYIGNHYSLSNGDFSDEYHVFSIVWESNSIKWYVDDQQFHSLTPAQVNGNYPFNNAFFFIFNIAVGGNWPGYPDATTQFPQQLIVDYIRVFQKN